VVTLATHASLREERLSVGLQNIARRRNEIMKTTKLMMLVTGLPAASGPWQAAHFAL